jgi:diadenosine tetraphosphate (Ap4A) HIT family hydrolase
MMFTVRVSIFSPTPGSPSHKEGTILPVTSNQTNTCPLCEAGKEPTSARPWLGETETSVVILDHYPSSKGHTLIIPKRHIGKLSDLNEQEQTDIWKLAMERLSELRAVNPDNDYTLGVNDGVLAGQTLPHVHLHIIPRVKGDVPDPRGGVRWVIPQTADYWTPLLGN